MNLPRLFRRTAVAMLLVAPALLSAQGPMPTGTTPIGTIDPFWTVSVNNGTAYNAFVIDRGPDGSATAGWIGASASGSLAGGAPDGNFSRFVYSFTTSFLGSSGMTITYRCARDDAEINVVVNGSAISGATCPGYNLSSSFTLSAFTDGLNSLQFNVGGNGITDGLIVEFTDISGGLTAVPEPASIVLLASGLLGVALMGRRRREV